MRSLLLGGLTVFGFACGKTNAQAIEELRPQFAPVRVQLAELSKAVREWPVEETALRDLEFDEKVAENSTVSILPFEQLADPDENVGRGSDAYLKRFDPIAGGEFLHCLNWTGPKNPMAASGLSSRNGDALKQRCEASLKKTRFLVIVETSRSVVPTLTNEGSFVGGAADLNVHVVEWAKKRVVSRFEVHGQPDQVVRYAVKPGDSKAVEAAVAVHSSMWSDARKKLFDGLTSRGGTVKLR